MIYQKWSTPIYRENVYDEDRFNLLRTYALCYKYEQGVPVDLNSQQFENDLKSGNEACSFVSSLIEVAAELYVKEILSTEQNVKVLQHIFLLFGKKGNSVPTHNHKNSHLTAVLYVDVPDGELVLYDPRSNANRGYPNEFNCMFESWRLMPKVGDLILMPSFVYHESLVSMSDIPRIAFVSDILIQFNK